jgi:hypothetical protein
MTTGLNISNLLYLKKPYVHHGSTGSTGMSSTELLFYAKRLEGLFGDTPRNFDHERGFPTVVATLDEGK